MDKAFYPPAKVHSTGITTSLLWIDYKIINSIEVSQTQILSFTTSYRNRVQPQCTISFASCRKRIYSTTKRWTRQTWISTMIRRWQSTSRRIWKSHFSTCNIIFSPISQSKWPIIYQLALAYEKSRQQDKCPICRWERAGVKDRKPFII